MGWSTAAAARRARADAAAVAAIGGFPFEICDLTADFDEAVIEDFVAEHAAGRTPNPCARCNGEIKFGAFLRRADELGIDLVATGHYVRSRRDDGAPGTCCAAPIRRKDQSYMLHMLGQAQLARSLFPVGGLPKAETRRFAERFGLPVAAKPDSQELCFAPSGDAGGFVRREAPALVHAGGDVVDPRRARCSATTTARSRSRSDSAAASAWRPAPRSMCSRWMRRGTASSSGPAELLSRRGLVADRGSWIAGATPGEGPFEAEVRIRYRGEGVDAVVTPDRGRLRRCVRRGRSGPWRRARASPCTGATSSWAAAVSCARCRPSRPGCVGEAN